MTTFTKENDSSTSSEVVEPTQPRQWSEQEIETLNRLLVEEQNWCIKGEGIDPTLPWHRATRSWEYRKCGRPDCRCKFGGDYRHGPYLVMIWKDLDSQYLNKVKRKYLGKSEDMDEDKVLSDYEYKMCCKRACGEDRDITATKIVKFNAIVDAAASGNKLAEEYQSKIKNHKVSVDWAYKRVFTINNKNEK